MKNKFVAGLIGMTFLVASVVAYAQEPTREPGPGPSEQPNAPFEIGQQDPGMDKPSAGQHAGPPPSMGQPEQQDDENAEEGGDAPSGEEPAKTDQGVARISMMHGDVSTQRGDSGDWSAAVLNQPVMGGDKVSTGDNARAEVQLEYSNNLRLGANSKANIANLTHKNIQIQISQGIANYTVYQESEAEPEIDTPNVAVHPAHEDGVFRIEVRPDGDTLVIVRKGNAQIATPQGSTEVHQGEMATIRGNSDSAQYKISEAPPRDDWDRWNSDRDHMIRNASSWKHTNRYYAGSEDLDAHGRWDNVPDYGNVWIPNEPEGWAPYRDGNWVYEPYYGWTWVGYEPWGWAPYHYGRWFWYGSSWAWWPGPVYGGGFYRPFWAPAYVSFFGWGGGFGFGFGGWGSFGWLPIGPCDRFFPWWGGYRGHFGFVGRGRFATFNHGGFAPLHGGTRFSNVAHFNDPHIGRGMSTVSAEHFGAGRFAATAASREQLGSARMMTGNMPVVPSRASLSASGRAAAPSTVRGGGSERFFGSHNNVARPASFQQETSRLQQSMQQSHVNALQAGSRVSINNSSEARGGVGDRGGSRSISQSNGGEHSNMQGRQPFSEGAANRGEMNRGEANSAAGHTVSGEPNRGEWKSFTPPSHNGGSEASREPGGVNSGGMNSSVRRSESGSYWNRTAPSSASAGRSSGGSYGGGSSRPQLNMHQPVVQPRSNAGGYRGSPSYGGSRPSYGGSAPRSAPSYGGGASHGGGYSGGGASHPSGGGGGGHPSGGGGGGGHSSGGGGHSGGGHH